MKILVCGSRNWTNEAAIYHALFGMPKDTIIINGDCKGADRISTKVAKCLDLYYDIYPANWNKYGKSAGPIRNQLMLDVGLPDLVIAFHRNIEKSKGTRAMCRRAKKQSIPVILITG